MNLPFAGVVFPNETQTVFDHTVPAQETWRLALLVIEHEQDPAPSSPGTLVAELKVHTGGEVREVLGFSGEDAFFRKPLFSVLEAGDRLVLDVTARHHDGPCHFNGYVSVEQTAVLPGGVHRVADLNGLVPVEYDHMDLGYTGGDVTTVVYKKSGTTVATLTLGYSGGKLVSVSRA